jgi:hypothetical protein
MIHAPRWTGSRDDGQGVWSDRSPRNLEISDELRAELDRRLERLDREGPVGNDWEDVLAEMKSA